MPTYSEWSEIVSDTTFNPEIRVSAAPLLFELEYIAPVVVTGVEMPTFFPDNAGTRSMHRKLPDEIIGYAFDPEYSWWAVVKAEATVNQIINPSFEGWSVGDVCVEYDFGGSFAAEEYVEFPLVGASAGRRCVRLVTGPGSGWLEYDQGLVVNPGPYTFALDVYVTRPDLVLVLDVLDVATSVAQRRYTMRESGWQRIWLTYAELGSGLRNVRLTAPNTNPEDVVFYSDAWQFEAKAYPTTYCDGDMVGFNDVRPYDSYYWTGEPHHSLSIRRETTGSGGRIISWSDEVKFRTTSIIGLGMTTVEPFLATLADGAEIHRGTRIKPRDFTITGRIFAPRYRTLLNRHNDLIDLLKPNNTLGNEQFILRYQQVDDAERLVGPPLDIVCVYKEGLEGNITNFYQENIGLQFHASQPFPMDVIESSAELLLFKELVENYMIFRDETGDYINLGTGSTNTFPTRVGFMRSGLPVAFGPFEQLAGDAVADAAYWDGSNWIQMGDLGGRSASDLDSGYATGYPLAISTTIGDVVEWDALSEVWEDLGAGFLGSIIALQRDINGDIWVAGEFTYAEDGITVYNHVAKWDSTLEEWQPLGEGLTDPSNLDPEPLRAKTVLVTNDGYVYFGGSFEQGDAGATTTFANAVIRWNIETQVWEGMGVGLNAAPNQLLKGNDGYIYAVGPFDATGTGSYALRGFAKWNGYQWEEVFPLVKVDGSFGADGMALDEDGIIWFFNYTVSDSDLFVVPGLGVMGTFGYKDGVFYPGFASISVHSMALGPGNRAIYAVRDVESRSVYRVPAMNLITYGGSADTPLVVRVENDVHPIQILNLSTKGGVYFKGDFSLGEFETLTIRTDTQKSLIYSNARPNLFKEVAAGPSNTHALRLRPGLNRLSVFARDETVNSRAWISWRNRFQSLDGALN